MTNQQNNTDPNVHSLDKRVAVLETQSASQSKQITQIHEDMEEQKKLTIRILENLRAYREADARERRRLFAGVLLTLLGVAITLTLALLDLDT